MSWNTAAAVLSMTLLAGTGLAFQPERNASNDQTAPVIQDAAIRSRYDALQKLQEQEAALNPQMTEKGLSRKLNHKIRSLQIGLSQKLGSGTVIPDQQQLQLEQWRAAFLMQEVHRMKAQRDKLQQRAALLHKRPGSEGLAGVLDQMIHLQQQINATEQELIHT